jgi:hypothetical protein
MKKPLDLQLTNRERFALFLHLKDIAIPNRVEGRRLDRVWSALELDPIMEAARRGLSESAHDDETRLPFSVGPEERDALIDYLDKQMTGGMARMVSRIGDKLIAHRDAADRDDESAIPIGAKGAKT